MQETLDDFKATIESAARRLREITEAESAAAPAPGKWSKKEVLGHLIDSASNNHQRFVRAQLQGELTFPGYEQDGWNATQGYREEAWENLVQLWQSYNTHLLHVMGRVPEGKFQNRCVVDERGPVALEFLMRDYVVHLKHHLGQIFG